MALNPPMPSPAPGGAPGTAQAPAAAAPPPGAKGPGGAPSMSAKLREVMAGLRHDLQVSRHVMRGEVTYILRDPVSFDTHAFSVADYRVLVALDGVRTLGEAFELLCARGDCQADHEEAYYRFVLDLHRSGLLSLPISDEKQLQMRHERKRSARRKSLLMAPLYLRIPVWNPDAFLARTAHLAAPLFTRAAFAVWCALALVCGTVLAHRWDQLAEQLPGLLAPEQLMSMWFLLAAMKVVHEFGHGYAVRSFGGTVPEMGVSLIMLTPCAYVDASASWAFPSRLRRIVVCLAGMYFESWIAAAALAVWCFTDAGALHSVAYQTMVLASVTTVGFNINPLLRYDGYFILSDLLQVPNLRQAANEQGQGLLRRVLLGLEGGRRWGPLLGPALVAYSLGAALLRVSIVLGMCAVIAMKFPVIGMAAGGVYGASVVLGTVIKSLRYLWFSKATAGVRARAVAVGAALLAVPSIAIATPLPRSVSATGVVERDRWLQVNAPDAGTLVATPLAAGAPVTEGQELATLRNEDVDEELAIARAELAALTVEREQAELRDPAGAARLREREGAARARLDGATRRAEALVVRAPFDGVVETSTFDAVTGRRLAAGDPMVLLASGGPVATLVLDQHAFARLRGGAGSEIELRSWADPGRVLHGTIDSIAPAGSTRLRSAALGVSGGGTIPVSPATGRTEESTVEVRVRLEGPDAAKLPRGSRIDARLPAEPESYGRRWYSALIWFNEKLSAAR